MDKPGLIHNLYGQKYVVKGFNCFKGINVVWCLSVHQGFYKMTSSPSYGVARMNSSTLTVKIGSKATLLKGSKILLCFLTFHEAMPYLLSTAFLEDLRSKVWSGSEWIRQLWPERLGQSLRKFCFFCVFFLPCDDIMPNPFKNRELICHFLH